MPRPTSLMLSRCCITWMRPSTAPRMPIVGENPPADSNTAGSRSSSSVIESRLTRMILRKSAGSVPSTASIRVCFRNGSSIAARSLSSETSPLRRALLANATIWRIRCPSSLRGALKTCTRLRNASTTVVSGNCNSTAPIVPPKTISAAVGCRIWPTFPPSIINPAIMPSMAKNAPPTLALSIETSSENDRLVLLLGVAFLLRFLCQNTGRFCRIQAYQRSRPLQIAKMMQPPRHHSQQPRAIRQDPFHNFRDLLAHNQLLSIDQGQHRIRRCLRGLDQVAVDHHRPAIQPRQFDHRPILFASIIGSPSQTLKKQNK